MTDSEYKAEAVRLRPKLLGMAHRYLAGDEAEDMVQDAMLRLWTMRAELRMPIDGLAVLLVRHLRTDRLRRDKRAAVVSIDDDAAVPVMFADDSGDAGTSERVARVMAIASLLPDMQQLVFRMRHVDGMEMGDIAAVTGCSEAAVRQALSRARRAIRDRYNKEERHS